MNEHNLFCLKYNLCATCLSVGRKLSPILDVRIVRDIIKIKSPIADMSICWECNAILMRIASFRNKARKARSIIENVMTSELDTPPKLSLSGLILTNLDFINILMGDVEIQDKIKIEPEEASFKIEDNKLLEGLPVEVKDEGDESQVEELGDEVSQELYDNERHRDTDNKIITRLDNKTPMGGPRSSRNNVFVTRILSKEEMLIQRENRKNSGRFHRCTLKCVKCIEIFSNKKSLEYHMKKHDEEAGEFLCDICEQRFYVDSCLKSHNLKHYRSYKCRVCETEFHNEDLAVKHHRDNHNEDGYACGVCHETFLTKKLCQLHRRSKHKNPKFCPLCQKRLGHNTDMKKHMQTHTSVSFECDVCHKKYRSESGMRTHRRTHSHEKNEAAYCAECDVQFKSTYTYKAHLQTSLKHVAAEDLKYKCPHCDKRWASAALRKYHIESMHTKELNYICKICDQAFNTSRRLRAHVRLKHEGKPKPKNKICSICSKAFTTKLGLQEHMNSHTGARPYVCLVCEATFSHSGALYTHNKLLHKKQKRRKPATPDRGLGEA